MIEPTQADREAAASLEEHAYIGGEGWRQAVLSGRSDDDGVLQIIARARIEGAVAMREAALRALKTAQYDPAPYTKGKYAITALDPSTILRDQEPVK